jgi:hypothetical protein
MSDYISELRQDLVEAAARQQAAGRGARIARPVRPRAWSPTVVLGTAAALAAVVVLVAGLRAVTPPRPPEAPKLIGTFHIGGQPRDAILAASGALLVADSVDGLVRIEQGGTKLVMPAGEQRAVSLAADGRNMWMVRTYGKRRHGTVFDLPPDIVKVSADGRWLGAIPLQGESGDIALGAGGIWVQTDASTGSSLHGFDLERVDPLGRRRALVVHGVDSQGLAASAHSVWTRHGTTVTQLSEDGRVVNRVTGISPVLGGIGQRTMVADDDGAWVVGQSDGLLYRIESGHVVKRLRVGELGGVIARTRSAVWVTALVGTNRYALVRVDPDEGEVTGLVRLGGDEPQTIVPIGKQIWVITQSGDVIRVSQG